MAEVEEHKSLWSEDTATAVVLGTENARGSVCRGRWYVA